AERGIGFVNIDQPLFSNSIKPTSISTAPVGYVRVHGRNFRDWFRENAGRDARYDYLYTAAELEPWAERTKEIAAEPPTEDVFVVTNNHYRGKAVANALMLEAMVKGEKVSAPPPLYAEYGEVLEDFATPDDRSASAAPAPSKPAAKPERSPARKSSPKQPAPKSPTAKKPAPKRRKPAPRE
ncbi:MAG TPA: DUF72 domain-containing protein, partial [Longimicrobium sp.]|nr:DUF72 domain-containing protein [Longimicrobium sp.]